LIENFETENQRQKSCNYKRNNIECDESKFITDYMRNVINSLRKIAYTVQELYLHPTSSISYVR